MESGRKKRLYAALTRISPYGMDRLNTPGWVNLPSALNNKTGIHI